MTLTTDQLKVLSFGYLTGNDLLQWCNAQLLIKQYEVDNNSLQRGYNQAIFEIISQISTRYDLTAELTKIGNVPASALAILNNGAISNINVLVPGTNFTTVPVISFTGGGGNGAAATASIVNNALGPITITAAGANYTTPPTVNIIGGQVADTRSVLLVKIITILAVRNIIGNVDNVSDKQEANFKWVDRAILDIRKGQQNLPINGAAATVAAVAELISDSVNTLG